MTPRPFLPPSPYRGGRGRGRGAGPVWVMVVVVVAADRWAQQLLFLNSPFSVMDSLVGLVGDRPLRRFCTL